MKPESTGAARRGAWLVVGALLLTLVPTFAARLTCVVQGGGRPESSNWCYSQIVPLAYEEDLWGDRLPYLDDCSGQGGAPCDEYPVLTMYAMWAATHIGHDPTRMFVLAGLLLLASASLVAWMLWRLVGMRALYFAAAPTLLLYGPMNWDLLAVAAMVVAVAFHLQRRAVGSGIAAGIGTATKLIPGLACAPMAFSSRRNGRFGLSSRFLLAALATWTAFNAPFFFGGPGWLEPFQYNAERQVDVDSLWHVVCRSVVGHTPCGSVPVINVVSALVFGIGVLFVWKFRLRADPETPLWTMGFPILVVFFLANKVYSPQYDLFLLPWFALVIPYLPGFVAFEACGALIFLARYRGFAEPSLGLLHLAVLLRAGVLIACLAVFASARVRSDTLSSPPESALGGPEPVV